MDDSRPRDEERSRVPSRRRFLGLLGTAAALLISPGSGHPAAAPARRGRQAPAHPDPRPGIDGSRVLKAAQLNAPDLAELFDAVREIPHLADGILCYCGCAQLPGYRSLLSCYEQPGMAQYCEICQGEARLAHARWKEGQTLAQIRRAIDARYGHGDGGTATSANVMQDYCHR